MDAKKLIDLRKQAEKAVAEMPDGEMKVKAFEVILEHLLAGGHEAVGAARAEVSQSSVKAGRRKETKGAKSLAGRILVLRDEGFFGNQRTLTEVRDELKAHGWHYALTALSGRMQRLVQDVELRRERVTQGNKKIWKYSNP